MSRPIPNSLAQPYEPGEIILPEGTVVYVAHECRGAPIYINFAMGDHKVYRGIIDPRKALEMASLLIQAAQQELCHPPKREE